MLHGAHRPDAAVVSACRRACSISSSGAAETDPVLAEWFLRRFSLLDSLWMVPSATLVGRTVRHNMALSG